MKLSTTLLKTKDGWIISDGLKFIESGKETFLETYEFAVLHGFIKRGESVYVKSEDGHVEVFPKI